MSSATLVLALLGAASALLGATLTAVVSSRVERRQGVTLDAADPLCLGCGHPRVAHRDTGCHHTTDGLRCACDAVLGFPQLSELDLRPRRAPEETDRG